MAAGATPVSAEATTTTSISATPTRLSSQPQIKTTRDNTPSTLRSSSTHPHERKYPAPQSRSTPTPRQQLPPLQVRRRRASAAIPLSPARSFYDSPVAEDRPLTSSSSTQSSFFTPTSPSISYSVLRSNNSGSELRSPLAKRPPASRSSHGIETSSGPPPALSTQRSQSLEGSWKLISPEDKTPKDTTSSTLKLTLGALARLDAANTQGSRASSTLVASLSPKISEQTRVEEGKSVDQAAKSPLKTKIEKREAIGGITTSIQQDSQVTARMDKERKRYSMNEEKRQSRRLSGLFANGAQGIQGAHEGDSQSAQEDFFLHLANMVTPGDTETMDNNREHRSSRIALPFHRQSLSNTAVESPNTQTPLPIRRDRRSSLQKLEMTGQLRNLPSTEKSADRDRPYAASSHPLDQRNSARLSGLHRLSLSTPRGHQNREESPANPNFTSRRSSITDSPSFQPRTYRSSHLQQVANGHYYSSPLAAKPDSLVQDSPPHPAREDGTASTASTAAGTSTVWDELDELKSRIRKLELDGKLPSSSNAAITNAAERPYTATTTVTTVSSSPKRPRGQSSSPLRSIFDNDETSLHPLLGSAVAKSKVFLSADAYRALEATASDAVTLAKMTNNTSAALSGSAPSAIDRQLKRKADNMCRSLTELCIALANTKSEAETEHPRLQPASRDPMIQQKRESSIIEDSRFPRSKSLDPEPSASQRVLSRLEARRASMALGSNRGSADNSPAREPHDQYAEAATPTQATLNRTSTVLQRIRNSSGEDDNDNTIRPLSRAMTDLGRSRSITAIPSKRMSREYKSHHPLPSPDSKAQATQNAQTVNTTLSSLPTRRSYLSNGPLSSQQQQQPSTPGAASVLGPRRFLGRNSAERTEQGEAKFLGRNSAERTEQGEARHQRLPSLGQYARTAGFGSVVGGRLGRTGIRVVEGSGDSLD